MKIELRNVKVARHLSEETTAYTATVVIDAIERGRVRNDGGGGCDHVEDYDAGRLLAAYAATLPERPWYSGTGPDKKQMGMHKPTAETVLADALDEALARKDFARDIGKRVVFVEAGAVRCTKTLKGPALDNAVAHWKAQGKDVLNGLPFEEAFGRWYRVVAPDGHPAREFSITKASP